MSGIQTTENDEGPRPEMPLPFEKPHRPEPWETAVKQALIDNGLVRIPAPTTTDVN